MGDEDSTLVDLLINEAETQKQLNYIRTLWLLNKEPELVSVIKVLEYALESCRVQTARNNQHQEEQQQRNWERQREEATQRQMDQNRNYYPTTTGITGTHTKPFNPWQVKYSAESVPQALKDIASSEKGMFPDPLGKSDPPF